MTSEEKRRIAKCRIAVVGATEFIDSIKAELQQLGFESIQIIILSEDCSCTKVDADTTHNASQIRPSEVNTRGVSL